MNFPAPRPSSASIWTKCAAYPMLAARMPERPETDEAREGTCAAWLAEQSIRRGCAPTDMIGEAHSNGWVVTPDMAHHIAGYVRLLRSYGGELDVERKVALNDLIEGTPDAFGVVANSELRVDDLKYGMLPVEVYENPQVVIYAAALLRFMSARGVIIRKIRLGIYQPRTWHPLGVHRTWTLWPEELMRRARLIEEAGWKTQDTNALATPGAHCRYCEAASICSAVTNAVYDATHHMHNAEARQMTAAEMATELDFLETAEAMFKARRETVRFEAEERIRRGEAVPGWMIEQGRGQRRWKADEATVALLTGVDPVEGKMVTPAELERRGADPEIVAKLTETPFTKARLMKMPAGYIAAKFGEL